MRIRSALGTLPASPIPAGNITGVSMVLTELAAKGLEILKAGGTGRNPFRYSLEPDDPIHVKVVDEIQVAGKALGVQLL